ncbi:retrovirus-related pol polyprotein from transposon TNT 1-94 [Tanacetum coccineum]
MAISELKKLVAKCKGKSVDTKFDKPSVVRQPNAQRIPKPSVLGKPAPFSNSLERKCFAKKKSVLKTNESESLSKPVTLQNLPQTAMQAVRNTNVIKPGMYRIARHYDGHCISAVHFVTNSWHRSLCNVLICSILGYGDLIKETLTIKGFTTSMRSSGQTILLTGILGSGLFAHFYVKIQCLHPTPICLMDNASPLKLGFTGIEAFYISLRLHKLAFKRSFCDLVYRIRWMSGNHLCSSCEDETPEVLKEFLMMIQRNLQSLVISVRTDRGTKFLNKTLNAFFKEEGIEHQTSTLETPEQERRLSKVETALRCGGCSYDAFQLLKLPLFFWAEAK